MSEKQVAGTSCQECVFAICKDGKQTGCAANRVEKFLQIEKVSSIRDYFFIHNRICTMHCKQKWLDNNPDVKDPVKEVRKRIALQCDALVLLEDQTIDDMVLTIESLVNQEHKPAMINVILNSNIIHPSKVLRQLKKIDIQWKLSNIEERGPEQERVSMEWCVDHVVPSCSSPFYSVFTSGFCVPPNFYKSIDTYINDDLHRLAALIPVDDWNGTFIQCLLHKSLHGNIPMVLEKDDESELVACSVIDKADYFSKKEDQPNMVKKAEEICPQMRQ